jgi:hypothetical protein
MHLFRCTFEKAATSANEHGVAGEYGAVRPVLEEKTDAVLRVAGRVQCGYINRADGEFGVVAWCIVNVGAVFSADYGNIERFLLDLMLEQINRRGARIRTISVFPPAWSRWLPNTVRNGKCSLAGMLTDACL